MITFEKLPFPGVGVVGFSGFRGEDLKSGGLSDFQDSGGGFEKGEENYSGGGGLRPSSEL